MGDYSSVAQAMQGAAATPDQSMPSGGTWSQILGHLKDTFGESGLYMTPAAIPLSARDAYNSATTPMDPSEMATPPDAQGNRIPDLSSWQGWKNGFSDLYHAMGPGTLALTGMLGGPKAPPKTPWVGYRPIHDAAADSLAIDQAARNAANPFDYSPYTREMNGANAAARADPAAIQAETAARQAHQAATQKYLDDFDKMRAEINSRYKK